MQDKVLALPGTKADFVYRTLHSEIMRGVLSPGQRLRLTELAAKYSMSQMPVREALRRLQADGLISFENHRGSTVSAVPLSQVVDIIATRTWLEVLAIAESTPHHSKQSLQKAQKINDELKKTRDPKRASELNRQFHVMLYEPCPNRFLTQEIDALWDKVWSTQQRSVFDRSPARVKGAADEHLEIVEALSSGSKAEVHKAALVHREHTLSSWKVHLDLAPIETATAA